MGLNPEMDHLLPDCLPIMAKHAANAPAAGLENGGSRSRERERESKTERWVPRAEVRRAEGNETLEER